MLHSTVDVLHKYAQRFFAEWLLMKGCECEKEQDKICFCGLSMHDAIHLKQTRYTMHTDTAESDLSSPSVPSFEIRVDFGRAVFVRSQIISHNA